MTVFFEWTADQNAISVDLAIETDALLDSNSIFECEPNVIKANDWLFVGEILDHRDSRRKKYFLSQDAVGRTGAEIIQIDPIDYYHDKLLPSVYSKYRESFTLTWCEVVKEVGTFSSPIQCQVQQFFRRETKFSRELFEDAFTRLPTSKFHYHPDSIVVDTQFEFNEQSLLDTVAISYVASQVSGSSYQGWEVNVLEIAELIKKVEH